MAVPTGVYTLENVKTRNWAVLLNDDDRSDVIAGTNADKDAGEKVTFINPTNGECFS
jgi:hypothetical protein